MTTPTDGVENLEFTKNPPPSRSSHDWARIAEVLKENPGKWTLAFRQERYTLAVAMRNGSIKALLPEDGFQVVTRNNSRTKPRMADIYLSYQPDTDTHLED